MKSQEELKIHAEAEEARERLRALAEDLRVVDEEVESLGPQREQHDLLDRACGSLERLAELGASSLFWGDQMESARVAERLSGVRSRVGAFQEQIRELDHRRGAILDKVGKEEQKLELLGEDLYDIRQEEERRKLEWVVERDISAGPPRVQVMAWSRGGEDDRRFRKALVASLMSSVLLGGMLPLIPLPLPARFKPDDMPRRIVQLVRQTKAKPLPPVPLIAEPPSEEQKPDPQKPKPVDEPKPAETEPVPPETQAVAEAVPEAQEPAPGPLEPMDAPAPAAPVYAEAEPQPEAKVEKAGILAFKDEFASLAKDKTSPRLGSEARYGNADDESRSQMPTRSMLTSNAPGSSGGINLGSLSRNVGGGAGGRGNGGGGTGGGGGGIRRVHVGKATSAIASIGGGGRPLAHGGPGLSRTDEEIQIVFDRYKARFYRLYNQELREDPTLQGQIVVRLTIEPDGSVSMCALEASDMDAPELASQVVGIVRTIDFGAKEGVQALTIVYPIDFLPAA